MRGTWHPTRLQAVSLGVAVAAAIAAAGSASAGAATEGHAAAGPIKIGATIPLTGPFTPLGVGDEQGLLLAEQQINSSGGINGRKVQFVIKDDQTSPQQSVVNFNALRSSGVVAVMGSSDADASRAIAPIAQRDGVPFMSLSPVDQLVAPTESYVFMEPFEASLQTERLLQYMQGQKYKKIAVVYDNTDIYTTNGYKATVAMAGKYGIKVVDTEVDTNTTTDFTSTLTHIKGSGANATLVWLTGPAAIGIAKAYYAAGLSSKIHMVMTEADASYALLVQPAGVAQTNGIVMTGTPANIGSYLPAGPIKTSYKQLAKLYKKKYGGVPSGFASNGYTAAEAVFAALKDAKSLSASAIDKAMQNVSVAGPDGVYHYSPKDHAGESLQDIMVFQVKNGKFVPTPFQTKQFKSLPS